VEIEAVGQKMNFSINVTQINLHTKFISHILVPLNLERETVAEFFLSYRRSHTVIHVLHTFLLITSRPRQKKVYALLRSVLCECVSHSLRSLAFVFILESF
jgi:hypothetical protein